MSLFGPVKSRARTSGTDVAEQQPYVKKTEFDAVVSSLSSAFETLMDRKPVVTVWAEENSVIEAGRYEWSFGNGAAGTDHALSGYTMLASGRLIRMGLALSTTHSGGAEGGRLLAGTQSGAITVNVVVNGLENASYSVTKPVGEYSATVVFDAPLELAQGDRVNFRSASSDANATSAIVCVLIELDM